MHTRTQVLKLYEMGLTGALPTEIGACRKLQELIIFTLTPTPKPFQDYTVFLQFHIAWMKPVSSFEDGGTSRGDLTGC